MLYGQSSAEGRTTSGLSAFRDPAEERAWAQTFLNDFEAADDADGQRLVLTDYGQELTDEERKAVADVINGHTVFMETGTRKRFVNINKPGWISQSESDFAKLRRDLGVAESEVQEVEAGGEKFTAPSGTSYTRLIYKDGKERPKVEIVIRSKDDGSEYAKMTRPVLKIKYVHE
jgi:hypothetical protein